MVPTSAFSGGLCHSSDEQQIEAIFTESDLIARYQQLDANLTYAETVDSLMGGNEEDVCSDEGDDEVEESKVTLKQERQLPYFYDLQAK